MGRVRRSTLRLLIAAVALPLALWIAYPLWMPAIGRFLVRADGPAPSEAALVLAGDFSGRRILKAGELAREGYVPKILVSGPKHHYGLHESELAIPFAVKHGYPSNWFVPILNQSYSTEEEAQVMVAELHRRGIRRFLLVTSDYHTRRAGKIYRSAAPDLQMRVVAAPDEFFQAATWWHNRESRKRVFFEWAKTVATALGL